MTTKTKYLIAALGVVAIAVAGVAYVQHRKQAALVPAAAPSAMPPAPPAVTASLPAPSDGDCLLPGPVPVPPYGATASDADMKLGHDVIQAFVQELENYQACRNAQVDHAGADVSVQQKQRWTDQGNAAVDQANALANEFAQQLKNYKAVHPGS